MMATLAIIPPVIDCWAEHSVGSFGAKDNVKFNVPILPKIADAK